MCLTPDIHIFFLVFVFMCYTGALKKTNNSNTVKSDCLLFHFNSLQVLKQTFFPASFSKVEVDWSRVFCLSSRWCSAETLMNYKFTVRGLIFAAWCRSSFYPPFIIIFLVFPLCTFFFLFLFFTIFLSFTSHFVIMWWKKFGVRP